MGKPNSSLYDTWLLRNGQYYARTTDKESYQDQPKPCDKLDMAIADISTLEKFEAVVAASNGGRY